MEGASTYLVAIALQRARAHSRHREEQQLRAALGNDALLADDLEHVRRLLIDLGAVAAVEERIDQLIASALEDLDKARLEAPADQRLAELVRGVCVTRS